MCMRHISLFEVLAGNIKDLTGTRADKYAPGKNNTFEIIERNVTLEGRYEQLDEINGHINPNWWRSVDHYDGFYYVPKETFEGPDYDRGMFDKPDSLTGRGTIIWN